ncbi:hypothetical protein [Cardinium endosymbiont of Tipula unca]|uniref:hypothetical protein n=1 Tax=Cardinium endosymbiont of Tipula unca TaxID=3066216 RepID=UPI0030D293D9
MFLIATILHTFIPPNPPFYSLFCSNAAITSPTNFSISIESFVSIFLVTGILPALLLYKYLHDKAQVKERVIELARAYERRSSLEAIYNQVNWARLDPSHGSKMLREMGKILDKPCQYLYAHGEQKLAENVDIFTKKLREFSNLLLN